MSRASEANSLGYNDGLNSKPYGNPYKMELEYDLWFEYDSGYTKGKSLSGITQWKSV